MASEQEIFDDSRKAKKLLREAVRLVEKISREEHYKANYFQSSKMKKFSRDIKKAEQWMDGEYS